MKKNDILLDTKLRKKVRKNFKKVLTKDKKIIIITNEQKFEKTCDIMT